MSVLSVVKLAQGSYECKGSCLRTSSTDVANDDFGSDWFKKFIFDMFDTLYSHSSGVGLAANQVGVLKRVCVIDIKRDGKSPLVLVNPSYVASGDEQEESDEVCLSFPLVASRVERYKKIKVCYYDLVGRKKEMDAEGFKAKVFQHEIDHLNGVVHIDLNKNSDGLIDYTGYSAKIAQNALDTILKAGQDDGEGK